MRIAIISDMHANDFAFEKVISDIRQQGVDQIVCNGDCIQGGPQPAQTVVRLRTLNCPVVMGNADAYLLSGVDEEDATTPPERLLNLNAVRDWSLSQLNDSDRAYIASFQPTVTIEINAHHKLLCFHGSPTSYNHVILPKTPDEEVSGYLGAYADHILTGGHTHLQQIRPIGHNFFFNPGSIGLAFSHQAKHFLFSRADYAILTVRGETTSLEFRRVYYDLDALIAIYRNSDRPYAEELIADYETGR
jgi:putative phosphoesterase